MSTFSDASSALDKELQNVYVKKQALDNATAVAVKASTEYQESLAKARTLRDTLEAELVKVFGETGRVRAA